MEAMEETRDELEQENLSDDNLIHRDEESQPQPEVKDDLAGELTKDLERKPKKPRSKAQIEAFEKARKALAEKRQKAKQDKETTKKPRGRPKKVVEAKKPKQVVFQVPEESDSSSSEEEVVYVQRKKPKPKKPKPKKQPRVVYVTDSDDDDDDDYMEESPAPAPQMGDWYNFV